MQMDYDGLMAALIYEEKEKKKWRRMALIVSALLVVSFCYGEWARARVTKMIEESEASTNQLVERLASAVSDERFHACIEEIYSSPTEEAKAGYLAPTSLEFDLPESEWEVSVVRHSDGTWRVWESKDGRVWGYGDVIEPKERQ